MYEPKICFAENQVYEANDNIMHMFIWIGLQLDEDNLMCVMKQTVLFPVEVKWLKLLHRITKIHIS